MRNAGLDEAQAGINIAGRNINNLRYAESEELKSLLMKVKEENEKVGLKLNIHCFGAPQTSLSYFKKLLQPSIATAFNNHHLTSQQPSTSRQGLPPPAKAV